jgi:hypothetical protein
MTIALEKTDYLLSTFRRGTRLLSGWEFQFYPDFSAGFEGRLL